MARVLRRRFVAAAFDLDGTLGNSAPRIRAHIQAACMQVLGLDRAPNMDSLHIGPPIDKMIALVLPDILPSDHSKIVAAYLEQQRVSPPLAQAYEGITELLAEVRGSRIRSFIVTNKRFEAARRFIAELGLGRFDDGEIMAIGHPKAELPTSKAPKLEYLARTFDLDPSKSIMVGDYPDDILAARSAGWRSAAVLWGYGTEAELRGSEPDHLIRTPAELASLLCTRQSD